MALVYPNTYPLAVSNLGYQVVYNQLNEFDDIVCERFVYPPAGEPLRSLESNRKLGDFPVVLGSISFEDDYPRLVALLTAGGIEPFSKDRAEVRIIGYNRNILKAFVFKNVDKVYKVLEFTTLIHTQ